MYGLVKNSSDLLKNFSGEGSRHRRKMILETLSDCMSDMNPSRIVRENVRLIGNTLRIEENSISVEEYSRILIVGAGKASFGMAHAMATILGEKVAGGFVITPHFQFQEKLPDSIKVIEVEAERNGSRTKEIASALSATSNLSSKDLVICLLSGGASSLLSIPAEGIGLKEKYGIANRLLRKGASIEEVNAVRKHLSKVKGGRLIRYLHPATVITLAISDVVDNPPDVIGSGLTVPDPTTYWDAIVVLMKYGIWSRVSKTVKQFLTDGLMGRMEETPKPKDPIFEKTRYFVLASHASLLYSASRALRKRQVGVYELTHRLHGEARTLGEFLARCTELAKNRQASDTTSAILATGESTVKVTGAGRGGRNQELALAFAINMRDMKGVTMCAFATDGVDGPTTAAGAIVDENTIIKATKKRMSLRLYLKRNNSHTFFNAVGDAIYTGPTGTNLGDLIVIITESP